MERHRKVAAWCVPVLVVLVMLADAAHADGGAETVKEGATVLLGDRKATVTRLDDVALRYATKARSPRRMRVNGEVVKGLESFTMEPTGDWRTWSEAALPAPVTLRQGRNVVRLTSLGGGGLNLNEITFSIRERP